MIYTRNPTRNPVIRNLKCKAVCDHLESNHVFIFPMPANRWFVNYKFWLSPCLEFENGEKFELKEPHTQLNFGGERVDLPEKMKESLGNEINKRKKIGVGKDKFADEIVKKLPAEKFSSFDPLISAIREIIL